MDHSRFDAIAQALGNRSARRPLLRTLGGALLGVAAVPAATADAAAKKKCKKPKVKCGAVCCPKGQKCIDGACMVPCKFVTQGSTRTLQADCTIDRTIQLGAGETLDGGDKTITMTGPISKYFGAAVVATRGVTAVRNLTLQGGNLRGACEGGALPFSGITLTGPAATLSDVTVREISNGTCGGFGVFLTSTGSGTLALSDVTISDLEQGLTIFRQGSGTGTVALDGVSLAALTTGARLQHMTGTVSNSTWTNVFQGVFIEGRSELKISDNTLTGVEFGVVVEEGAAADVTNNIIQGTPPAVYGIGFESDAMGSASGNTISNFQNGSATTGCGIRNQPGSDATIGANTFANNEQNICNL